MPMPQSSNDVAVPQQRPQSIWDQQQAVRQTADDALQHVSAAVGEPRPLGLHGFCAALSDYRGRLITVHTLRDLDIADPLPLSGMWLATASTDYIIFDDQRAGRRWPQTALHQISHVILDEVRVEVGTSPHRFDVCPHEHTHSGRETEAVADRLAIEIWDRWGDTSNELNPLAAVTPLAAGVDFAAQRS
jgi:hypothetical protein